jgi:AbrB family looped-hinge helix DNA binding protein
LLVVDFWLFEVFPEGFVVCLGFELVVVVLERFVAKVLQGGKVTVPKRVRELLGVEEGDYVRLVLVEVIEVKKG